MKRSLKNRTYVYAMFVVELVMVVLGLAVMENQF